MIRDDIERVLKAQGWKATMGVPAEVIDFQRDKPYNRLIIYPEDTKYITREVLVKLMGERSLPIHGEILLEAKKAYEKSQMKLTEEVEKEKVTEVVDEAEKQAAVIREKIKELVNKVPAEYLSDLYMKLKEFWVERKGKPGVAVPVSVEEERTAVVEMETSKDTQVIEEAFDAIREGTKDYRSAVVVDNVKVRAVACDRGKKYGLVMIFTAKDYENAIGIRMLFDGALNRELIIVSVEVVDDRTLSVIYRVTGIKPPPKIPKKKIKTGSRFEHDDTLEFWKKKRGEE